MSQDITYLAGQCLGDKPTYLHNDIIKTKPKHGQSACQFLFKEAQNMTLSSNRRKIWTYLFYSLIAITIVRSNWRKKQKLGYQGIGKTIRTCPKSEWWNDISQSKNKQKKGIVYDYNACFLSAQKGKKKKIINC